MVTRFAAMAVCALCVVQAFEAGARTSVAGSRVVHVDVVATLARQTAPSGHLGVTVVTRGTLVTPGSWRADGDKASGTDITHTQTHTPIIQLKQTQSWVRITHSIPDAPGPCPAVIKLVERSFYWYTGRGICTVSHTLSLPVVSLALPAY